jgi:hypothetical protein
MKIVGACLFSVIALAPLAAFAQVSDAVYCDRLATAYRTLNSQNMDATVPEAINQCKQGNTAAGIPVLEKALKDAKGTLPSRN